jgi:hypothetical protein
MLSQIKPRHRGCAVVRRPSSELNYVHRLCAVTLRRGVSELDREKLTPLLNLKCHNSIRDAVADLGKPDEIGRVFVGFQKFLYLHPQAG